MNNNNIILHVVLACVECFEGCGVCKVKAAGKDVNMTLNKDREGGGEGCVLELPR